jgi:hypothetical protein
MKKAVLFFTILHFTFFVNAQNWTSANGVSNYVWTIISYNDDTLLAGVYEEGIYISYDGGNNWSDFALPGENIYSLIKIGNTILAGTEGNDIYKTTSLGSSWQNIYIDNVAVYSLSYKNDILYACAGAVTGPGGVYASLDTGNTWNQYGSTPPYTFFDIDFSPNGRAFVGTVMGIYYSDNQSPWVQTYPPGQDNSFSLVYLGNDSIIYGFTGHIYLSIDNGISAQQIENLSCAGNEGYVFYIEDTIYAATSIDLLYSPDHCAQWISLGLSKKVYALIKHDGFLIAGTDEGIYINSGDPTIVENKSAFKDYKLFPNPTRGMVYIRNLDSETFNIEIININGQIEKTTNNSMINLSDLSSGLYYYRLQVNERTYFGKIVKE